MGKLNTGEADKRADKLAEQLTTIEKEIVKLGYLCIESTSDNSILEEDLAYVSGIGAALLSVCRRAMRALQVVRQDSSVDIDAILRDIMKEPPK
ncbi:MAG TPA: hypothetical protein VJ508_05895 [Saprospiraceae bacterium]|nr:hypothetical protein [Saprospiraceae bacterium]